VKKSDLHVDWATHASAKYACENWHYSKKLPCGSLVKIGAWENGKFVGVVIFSRGATPEIGSPYNLRQDEICELTRVALTKHSAPVSRILAVSFKFLHASSPRLRLIVSFADSSQGHHGGIYQATNWVYAGASKTHAYRVLGKVEHPKTLHSRYGIGGQSVPWLRANIDKNAERIIAGTKHRYLMPLDAEMRAKIELLAKTYPKRLKQAMAEAHSEQRRCNTDPNAPTSNTAK